MRYTLENDELIVEVDSFGAELRSIRDKKTGKEYMWNADPAFWKRTAPVLFPFVGSVRDQKYSFMGESYPMGQHGFARDNEFVKLDCVAGSGCDIQEKEAKQEIWFEFRSNEETMKVYPFEFVLRLGYVLSGRCVTPHWAVRNPSETENLYYSLGGHPAFMCPALVEGEKDSYELVLADEEGKPVEHFISSVIGKGGLLSEEKKAYKAENGRIPICPELFEDDALILEEGKVCRVGLAKEGEAPYLNVSYDAPLVGIWSPPGKRAPFICIEPWYGRCDKETFEGSLEEREWGNMLIPGDYFHTCYSIYV